MYGKYTSPIDPMFLLVHSTSTMSCAEQFFQLTQDVNVTKLAPGELVEAWLKPVSKLEGLHKPFETSLLHKHNFQWCTFF